MCHNPGLAFQHMLRDHLDKTRGSIHAIPESSHSVMVDGMKAKLKGPEMLECQV